MSGHSAVPAPDGERWAVLVPGLGLDAREWAGVWPLLTTASTVVTLPSLGRPARRGDDLDVEALAGRLVARLPATGRLLLVGHSASCPVVAEAAAGHPRVEALVLVGPTTDPAAAGWPGLVGRWLRTAGHERPGEVPALARQYRRTGLRSMAAGLDRIRRHRVDRALGSTSAHVVVIRGEYDRIAPDAWCRHLASTAGGQLRTVAGGAHMVPLTHPDAVAQAVSLAWRPVTPQAGASR